MIRKQPAAVSPSFELTIDNAEVRYQSLDGINLILEENKHDMLKLRMSNLPPRAITEYRNRGVRLNMDTGAGYSETFNGYVEKVNPTATTSKGLVNGSPFQDVTIVALGASYEMRGAKSKVWDRYKLHEVALNFAKKYHFSLDCPESDLLYNTMVQTAESDWQFLVRYAGLLGYSVTCHGTHIHVFDPYKASNRGISYNKLLTTRFTGTNVKPHPGVVIKFDGQFKESHADGVYKDTIVTVMQDDGQQYDVSTREIRGVTSPARFENRLNIHAGNYEEAVRMISAADKSHYDYEAEVNVIGMLGCRPGGVVDLDGYNAEFDGLWYVSKVEHTLASGAFMTNLNLKRNVVSQLTQDLNVRRLSRVPGSKVVDRSTRWRTERNQYRVYA